MRHRVLVVENDATIRLVTEDLLTENGYKVVTEAEAAPAIARIKAWEFFNLAVIEPDLGLSSGYDVMRALPSTVPVIVSTGHGASMEKVVRETGRSPHLTVVLPKPYVFERLVEEAQHLVVTAQKLI